MIKALLNDEGKKVWGFVFSDGEAPVKNLVDQTAILEGKGEEQVYLVDWAALSQDQQSLILNHLGTKFHAPIEEIEAEISKKGLPLRAKYVSCTLIPARFF